MSTASPSLDNHLSLTGRTRPRTLTIAAALLLVQAVLGLVGLVVSFALRDVAGEGTVSANAIARQFSEGPTNISLWGVGSSVLLSVSFLVLAVFVLRGSGPARTTAWVVSGIGLLGFGVGGLFSAPSAASLSVPDWYLTYSAIVSALVLVTYAAIIVLVLASSGTTRTSTPRTT